MTPTVVKSPCRIRRECAISISITVPNFIRSATAQTTSSPFPLKPMVSARCWPSAAIRPQVRISNVISQVQAVASGLALGVLPCFLAAREPELVRLLPQEIGLRRCYWLLTHADARDLVRVQVVAEFIRERLAARGAAFWLPSLQAGSAG